MPSAWKNLTKPDWLIEGSVAPSANGQSLLQIFRTSRLRPWLQMHPSRPGPVLLFPQPGKCVHLRCAPFATSLGCLMVVLAEDMQLFAC